MKPINPTQRKILFLLGITIIYISLLIGLDFLRGPRWQDEGHFWITTTAFSDQLFPSLDRLRDYKELNTPLPFIMFGALEYLFGKGIAAGRLLNLILSLIIVFIIGWPSHIKQEKAILCVIGLFLCPYYLWYSGRLYTDIIACFWVLIGVVGYVKNRHFISCIAFVLAISSRQYMLAFPVAIAVYELIAAAAKASTNRRISPADQWRWLAPSIAALSIFGWIYLFQGLAPEAALEVRPTPEVQKTVLAFTPGGMINFFAFVGVYIVIPEFILFGSYTKFQISRDQKRKAIIVSFLLLMFCLAFPPLLFGLGHTIKIANILPYEILKVILFYGLSLLACIRFSRPDLISLIVFFNGLIMIKAYPWDKYILPLAVVFWYLKSINFDGRLTFSKTRPTADSQ